MMSPGGAGLRRSTGRSTRCAPPRTPTRVPDVWLLGSVGLLGQAGRPQGLPYVFAHHFSGEGTPRRLELYRSAYQPSETHAEPRTFLTVNASVADTAEEADASRCRNCSTWPGCAPGNGHAALDTVEEAAATELTPAQEQGFESMTQSWVIGEPADAAARIRDLADASTLTK